MTIIDRLRLIVLRLLRPSVSPLHMKISHFGARGLKAVPVSTRVGLYELTEIIRLGHTDEKGREIAKMIQMEILAKTKTKDNLLPHEKWTGKDANPDNDSKLLPRHDLFF